MILHVFVNLILYIHVYKKKQDTIDQISHYFLLQKSSQGSSAKHANSICTFIINHIEDIYKHNYNINFKKFISNSDLIKPQKESHPTTWSGILCHAVLKERRRSRMDIK